MVPTAAPLPVPTTGVNPTITQLMQQHPTLSLQEIIAKMQASTVSLAAAAAQKPARELYVGNLPPNVTGPQLQEFLSTIVLQVGLTTQPGTPIVHTWLSTDGHFAFCEMRTVEECTLALLLNQLPLLNQPLKFGRPRSYMGPPLPFPLISERAQAALLNLGCVPNPAYFSTTGLGLSSALAAPLAAPPVAAMAPTLPPPIQLSSALAAPATAPADPTSNRLLMSNIPVVLIEAQVRELVEPFGPLKSLTLLLDPVTGASTGTAVFEYERASVTDDALQGLDGLDIGGIPLSLRRAPPDANAGVAETSDVVKLVRWEREGTGVELLRRGLDDPIHHSLLTVCGWGQANMVSIDELTDDDEFSDLKEDVEEECKRFGNVVDLVIPRPQVRVLEVPILKHTHAVGTSGDSRPRCVCLAGRRVGVGSRQHLCALQCRVGSCGGVEGAQEVARIGGVATLVIHRMLTDLSVVDGGYTRAGAEWTQIWREHCPGHVLSARPLRSQGLCVMLAPLLAFCVAFVSAPVGGAPSCGHGVVSRGGRAHLH